MENHHALRSYHDGGRRACHSAPGQTADGAAPSRRGIPVILNTQGGYDSVTVRDTASEVSSSLALRQSTFRDLFPVDLDAVFDWADVFDFAFREDSEGRLFTTVVLAEDSQRPVNVNIRQSVNQSLRENGENLVLIGKCFL